MREEMLLAYFDRLIDADKNGYICHREMAEVIEELRKELGICPSERLAKLDLKLEAETIRKHVLKDSRP